MAKRKDYLVITERLGTTFNPKAEVKAFQTHSTMADWGLRNESHNKLISIFEIIYTQKGVKLKAVY